MVILVTLPVLEGHMWLVAIDLGQHSHWTFPSLQKVLLDSTVSPACLGRGADHPVHSQAGCHSGRDQPLGSAPFLCCLHAHPPTSDKDADVQQSGLTGNSLMAHQSVLGCWPDYVSSGIGKSLFQRLSCTEVKSTGPQFTLPGFQRHLCYH